MSSPVQAAAAAVTLAFQPLLCFISDQFAFICSAFKRKKICYF
jgi:hypothetical protein